MKGATKELDPIVEVLPPREPDRDLVEEEAFEQLVEAFGSEKAAKAWRILTAAASRRDHIMVAHKDLVAGGAFAYPRDAGHLAPYYRRPELATPLPAEMPAARRLALILESGAEPAILSPDEIREPASV